MVMSLRAIFVVAALLLSGVASSQESPSTPASQNSDTNQQTAAPSSIIVNVIPLPKTETDAEEEREERKERKEKAELDRRLVDLTAELSGYTGGLFYATLVLAIATIFLVAATIGLVVFARRQALDTKILQRAYIAVEPGGIHLKVGGDSVIGHIGIRNTGHLPARRLSWYINIKRSDIGNEETFPLEGGKGNIVVSPGANAVRGSDKCVNLRDLLAACGSNDGRARASENPVYLYVWGAVYYHDGFKDGRTTEFCHRYNWIMRSTDAGEYDISEKFARYHEYGNGAD